MKKAFQDFNSITNNRESSLEVKISIFLLISVIYSSTLIADNTLPNSLLSIPLLISTVTSFLVVKYSIPKLHSLRVRQIIRKEGPTSHHKKSGTPTMGGLFTVPVGIIIGNLLSFSEINNQILGISIITLTYMIIVKTR